MTIRPASERASLLELCRITKNFGPVEALRGVDFSLEPGEVHALLGENGAGKSTLMHIAFGMLRATDGRVLIDGAAVSLRSPREARRLGLGMVHQHFTSIPAFTVAENIALAAGWSVRPQALRTRVAALMQSVGLELDQSATAESLGVELRQRLEILKALAADPRGLLLDEPTAVFSPPEGAAFLDMVRRFAAAGGAAVLITHKLEEALRSADRITVLRHGMVTWTGPASAQTGASLAAFMLGTNAGAPRSEKTPHPGIPKAGVAIRCEGLQVARDGPSGSGVRHADLSVLAGEIVGVAGVEGNGQRELLRAIAGLIAPSAGRMEVVEPRAFIPEDRTTEGLIPRLSLTENLVLGRGEVAPWIRRPWIRWAQARTRTLELVGQFNIHAPGPDAPAGSLSGGNQQRLVIARALDAAPRVVVAENPTRGLDVQASGEVHFRLREAARAGGAVLFYSSDLDEVLELADRIVVMANGRSIEASVGAGRAEVGALMLMGEQRETRDERPLMRDERPDQRPNHQ